MNVSQPQNPHSRRILFAITKANWGGAQRYVFDLAMAAKTAGHEVLVAYGEPGILAAKLEAAGIRSVQISALGRDVRLKRDSAALGELVRFMKEFRPDVIHLNSSKAGVLGAFAARIAGVRNIIFTAHGWAFNEDRPLWQRIAFGLIHGAGVLMSTTTICVSEATRHDMRWLPFSAKKFTTIHNGVDCDSLAEKDAARTALLPEDRDGTWIGMISELHPTKRVSDAIEAMALLGEAHPDAKLVVLGEGEERATLETLIRQKSLENKVHLAGFVKDASRQLKAFDIFLHASRSEALGYVILEAGCGSLPVVATNVGGIPEIITGSVSGMLVPKNDPERIASALASLLDNPEYAAQLGSALHDRVLKDFSKKEMIIKTLALYTR